MEKETIELRLIPHFRISIELLKDLGFKEIKRSPVRLRMNVMDDLRCFRMHVDSNYVAKFSKIKQMLTERTGLLEDEAPMYGKKCVGDLTMKERNHFVFLWK